MSWKPLAAATLLALAATGASAQTATTVRAHCTATLHSHGYSTQGGHQPSRAQMIRYCIAAHKPIYRRSAKCPDYAATIFRGNLLCLKER